MEIKGFENEKAVCMGEGAANSELMVEAVLEAALEPNKDLTGVCIVVVGRGGSSEESRAVSADCVGAPNSPVDMVLAGIDVGVEKSGAGAAAAAAAAVPVVAAPACVVGDESSFEGTNLTPVCAFPPLLALALEVGAGALVLDSASTCCWPPGFGTGLCCAEDEPFEEEDAAPAPATAAAADDLAFAFGRFSLLGLPLAAACCGEVCAEDTWLAVPPFEESAADADEGRSWWEAAPIAGGGGGGTAGLKPGGNWGFCCG